MEYSEMVIKRIKQNLISSYRKHCQLKLESREFKPVLKNLEQRDIVWFDVWCAVGMRVEEMEDIYDEEYKKFRDKRRKQAGLKS